MSILSVLAAIGWWGHTYHWSFSHAHEAEDVDLRHASAAATINPSGKYPSGGESLGGDSNALEPAVVLEQIDLTKLPAVEFGSSDAAKRCGVDVSSARQQAMDEFVVAHGTIDYDHTHLAQLSVRVPGVVWRVEKRVGDFVHRDEVLAIVDSAEVGQAKASLIESTVLYNLKSATLKRLESVANAIPGRELEQARADQQLAKAQQLNALQRLVNLGFPIQQADLEGTTLDDLSQKLQLLGLPDQLATQTESTNLVPLRAPFDGIVTQCHIVRGETVEPLSPQYVVANTERMWIDLDVRQEDAARLKLGSTLQFTCETDATPVIGTLTWIGTEIDQRTRTVHARGEVANPIDMRNDESAQRTLRAGTFGSAQILVHQKPGIVAVPNSALHWQWELEQELVFIPSSDGTKFFPRVVTVGEVRDGWVHVLSGIEPGEKVVSAGSRVLSSELSRHLQRQIGENADAVRPFNQATFGLRTLR